MSSYKKVIVKQTPLSGKVEETPENRYWSKFTSKHTEKFAGKVSQISFGEKAPHNMLVCAATRVHVYDIDTMTVKKNVTRFTTPVNCASVRDDGQALIAGSDDGLVQLFDLSSRAILRSFSHKSAVHVAKFVEDGTRIFSASDDKTVKLFDLPSEAELFSWTAHTDHVRCGLQSSISPDVIVTGSYDHTIKLFDIRDHVISGQKSSSSATLSLDHGAPVNSIVMFPHSGMLASAGDNYVRIWDLMAGGKLLNTFSYHQKTITSLSIDGTGTRLLSAGLDGFVKFYDVSNFSLTHSMQFAGPLLSVGISPDCSTIATGFVDGTLSTKQRPQPSGQRELPHRFRSSAYAHFHRGAAYKGDGTDVVLETERKQHVQRFEAFLKSFQYGAALDAALQTNDPKVVVSLIDELVQRAGLKRALQNRTDATLEPVLKFVVKYIANPNFTSYLIDVVTFILDVYTPVIGQSPLMDQLLYQLQTRITDEVTLQDDCTMLQGELDLILASVVPDMNDFTAEE